MKRTLIILALLVLVAIGGATYWVYRELHTSVQHARNGQYIEINRGSSPDAVIKKLCSEGVLRYEWPLLLYVKLTGAAPRLKAGDYDFPTPITPLQVLNKLEEGQQRFIRLTIVEGWTRWDIANAMAKVPALKIENPSTALALMNDVSLVKDLDPAANNLEGYLYPATYEFSPDTKPAELIALMVKRFRTTWKADWSEKAKSMKMSPRQIVTTASLIETEAKLETERPIIAAVVYNRLKLGMPLGVDSSIIYASKLEGKWRNDGKVYKSDIDRRSPYNTRLNPGLPPGPIASPGESSLHAALNPDQVDYLYYVREPSRNDGTHNFYSNERDFGAGVQALREWERQRDAENAQQDAEQKNQR
ncbi:MAG: endolytic transglycosylase MltG [Acidobacteriota bacterium]